MNRRVVTAIEKKLVGAAVVLFLVSLFVVWLMALAPGSVVTTVLGTRNVTPEAVEQVRSTYNLDDPLYIQYGSWIADAARGDLGRSLVNGEPVVSALQPRIAVTFQLALLAVSITLAVGLPLGVVAGLRAGSAADGGISGVAVLGMSAPPVAVGLILIYVFSVLLGWLPAYGAGSGGVDRLQHLILPAVTMAIGLTALVVRQTRAATLNLLGQDYMTFAKARGLGGRPLLFRYALKNSAVPIVTSLGVVAIWAVAGTILVEKVFSVPGVGLLLVDGIRQKDIPMVQGATLFLAFVVVVSSMLADIVSLIVDPRLQSEAGR